MSVKSPSSPAPPPVETNNSEMDSAKTEIEKSMESLRFLMLVITASFILLSLMMVIVGTLVYSDYHSFSAYYNDRISLLLTPSALAVFIALAMLIVSIFGYLGNKKRSVCMINAYACILMTLFIIKLVVVIIAFTIDTGRIMYYIDIPLWGYNDLEFREVVDALQTSFGCCGSNNYLDYLNSYFTVPESVMQANVTDANFEMVTITVPKTCCISYTEGVCDIVSGVGCKEALVTALLQNSTVIGVLVVCDMIINLLGIIIALLVARYVRKTKSARALITWKLRENVIMQSQAVEKQKYDEGQVHNIDHQTFGHV